MSTALKAEPEARARDEPLTNGSAQESLFGKVLDELTDRMNHGEELDLEAYIQVYPQIAGLLREVGPILRLARPPKNMASAPSKTVPDALGDYRILREIGRGGMGVVYEAVQQSLGRHVAVKVLPPQAVTDPIYLKRFQQEARAAGRLHHTNIVPVFGVGEHEGTHYYAMQFIRGRGLDVVIRAASRLAQGIGTADVDTKIVAAGTGDGETGGHRPADVGRVAR